MASDRNEGLNILHVAFTKWSLTRNVAFTTALWTRINPQFSTQRWQFEHLYGNLSCRKSWPSGCSLRRTPRWWPKSSTIPTLTLSIFCLTNFMQYGFCHSRSTGSADQQDLVISPISLSTLVEFLTDKVRVDPLVRTFPKRSTRFGIRVFFTSSSLTAHWQTLPTFCLLS